MERAGGDWQPIRDRLTRIRSLPAGQPGGRDRVQSRTDMEGLPPAGFTRLVMGKMAYPRLRNV